jgi:hypothetical protein
VRRILIAIVVMVGWVGVNPADGVTNTHTVGGCTHTDTASAIGTWFGNTSTGDSDCVLMGVSIKGNESCLAAMSGTTSTCTAGPTAVGGGGGNTNSFTRSSNTKPANSYHRVCNLSGCYSTHSLTF